MVDAQAVAKHALQTLHQLYGQRYLGQQVEHLLLAVQGMLYQMDVYLSLAARRHAVQQRHLLFHHRHQNAVIGILLGQAQRLDEFRTVGPAVVQASHLHLVELQHLALLQLF